MKKLINDPFDFVEESLEGFLLAHADTVKRVGKRAVGRKDGPTPGKAGVVVGGGSGHLPAFVGYVGKGGADAAPVGNIFASPPAKPVREATLAADGGAGVLYSYGNYTGDVMNFDRAAAQAAAQGIPVDNLVAEMTDYILKDLDFSGSDVAVLVNGLGATPYEELYILYRKLAQILEAERVSIKRSYVGEYVTSLEMAGASITLLRLDDELLDLIDAPA